MGDVREAVEHNTVRMESILAVSLDSASITELASGKSRTLQSSALKSSKQPLMVRTFLKVYMELGSYFLFLQEQIKDIIIIRRAKKRMFRKLWNQGS